MKTLKSHLEINRPLHTRRRGSVLKVQYLLSKMWIIHVPLKVNSVEIRYWLGRCSLVFTPIFVQKTQTQTFVEIKTFSEFLFIPQKFDQNNRESKEQLISKNFNSSDLKTLKNILSFKKEATCECPSRHPKQT